MISVPQSWAANYAVVAPTLAAIFTLGIMSVLWKENLFYRACEHIFVGATAAYNVVTTFSNTIKPGITENMIQKGEWWELIPICLGLLIYFQPHKDLRWLARFPTAFWIGYNAGMNLTIRTFMPLLVNIRSSMIPWFVVKDGAFNFGGTLSNLVFSASLILTMLYFVFSFEGIGTSKPLLSGGRWVMMVAFGASFGSTVMSRVSLFLGRAEFLLVDWLGIIQR